MQKIHVVFGESIERSLRLLRPDRVVALSDDLSSGPLGDMLSEAAEEDRIRWWTHVLTPSDPTCAERYRRSWQRFRTELRSCTAHETVVIWVAENPAEVTGYWGVLAHLPAAASVAVIHVSQAYARAYNAPDAQYFIKHTNEIAVDKLAALLDDAMPLPQSDRQDAIERWHRLVESGGHLRHVVNGQVETIAVDYWDPFIVEQAQSLFQRRQPMTAARLVGECMGWQPQITSEALVFWRIRRLIESGAFTYTGSLDTMRD